MNAPLSLLPPLSPPPSLLPLLEAIGGETRVHVPEKHVIFRKTAPTGDPELRSRRPSHSLLGGRVRVLLPSGAALGPVRANGVPAAAHVILHVVVLSSLSLCLLLFTLILSLPLPPYSSPQTRKQIVVIM